MRKNTLNTLLLLLGLLIFLAVSLFLGFYLEKAMLRLDAKLDAKVSEILPFHNAEQIKQGMNYHGCLFTERDMQTGEWHFYRNGKRCRLLD